MSDISYPTMKRILHEFFYEHGNCDNIRFKYKEGLSVQTILRDFNPNSPELLPAFMEIWNYDSLYQTIRDE